MTKLNTFQQVRELSDWRAKVFACALVERMLPNYQLFCEATSFSDATDMSNLVNILWEVVLNPKTKINYSVQLEKIEEATPDVQDFDNYGVYPALDFSVAIEAAFNLFSGDDPQGAVVISKVSQGCVEAFIDATSDAELNSEDVKAHPVMRREIEFQQALLAQLNNMQRREKEQLQAVRQFGKQDGMSNIGIAADTD
ncbi:MAG: YjaG family protein [Aestuariibacter sp.]